MGEGGEGGGEGGGGPQFDTPQNWAQPLLTVKREQGDEPLRPNFEQQHGRMGHWLIRSSVTPIYPRKILCFERTPPRIYTYIHIYVYTHIYIYIYIHTYIINIYIIYVYRYLHYIYTICTQYGSQPVFKGGRLCYRVMFFWLEGSYALGYCIILKIIRLITKLNISRR